MNLGQGLGIGAGGAVQGFNTARQQSIEQAYLKMQQQRQQIMQQQYERELALDPFRKMLTPETAPAVLPAYSRALDYAKNPEGFSYQPPDIPTEGPAMENGLGPAPVHQPPVYGSEGYASMLGDAGKQARELQIEAENRKVQRQVTMMLAQIEAWREKRVAAKEIDMDSAEELARRRSVGTHEGNKPYVQPEAEAKAAGTGIGSGKVRPNPARTGVEQVPPVLKVITDRDLRDIASVREAMDTFDSIKGGLEAGELPEPGAGKARINSFLEKAGGWIPGNPTLDDPATTGFYKFLKGTALERLKAAGGVRAAGSPTELRATQSFFAQPENSPGGLRARVGSTSAQLHKQYDTILSELESGGYDVSSQRKLIPHLLSSEDITGVPSKKKKPSASAPPAVQADPNNLGYYPVPPPIPFKTFQPDQ